MLNALYGFFRRLLPDPLKEKIPEILPESLIQFVKFGMVGALNTLLSFLIINGVYILLGYVNPENSAGVFLCREYREQTSNVINFIITVFISFLLNSMFVFQPSEEGGKQPWYIALAKVYASYAFTELVVMGLLLRLEVHFMGLPMPVATLVNLVVTVPLNFILNKFWAYKDRK